MDMNDESLESKTRLISMKKFILDQSFALIHIAFETP